MSLEGEEERPARDRSKRHSSSRSSTGDRARRESRSKTSSRHGGGSVADAGREKPHREHGRERSDGRRAASDRDRRDAQSKARARRDGGAASLPGAATAKDGGERDRLDSESKARAKRSAGAASLPGATAEGTSRETGRDRSDREAKDRARRGRSERELKPGAVSASNRSESREDRKLKRHSSRRGRSGGGSRSSDRDAADSEAKQRARLASSGSSARAPGASRSSENDRRVQEKMKSEEPSIDVVMEETGDGEVQLQAVAVEDAENEQLKEQQAQIERLKQQMDVMAQQNHHAPDRIEEDENDDANENNDKPPKNRWKCVVAIVAVLAIGGGVAGYILGTAKSPPETPQVAVGVTSPPSVAGTTAEPLPSTLPSTSPTPLQVYRPPSKEDCDAIASGLEVSVQDSLYSKEFAVEFDATLSFQVAEEVWLGSLKEKLQSNFLPAVAGCTTRRSLRESSAKQDRKLQLLPDFAIANGKVGEATVMEGGCDGNASPLCFRTRILMDISLRDDSAKLSFVEAHMIVTLGASPINLLGLETLLSNLVTIRAAPTAPTDEPSFSPSMGPTTAMPTDAPSANPSFAPVTGPTTLEPTKGPTNTPVSARTESPTASPSMAPVVAPTLAPVVGPTPPPTQSPTMGPTEIPTPSPTYTPTSEPTMATLAPTVYLSSSPTSAPTIEASLAPTAAPTLSPTLQDSQSPTATVNVITPSATAKQSSEFSCWIGVCAMTPPGAFANGVYASPASKAIDGNTDGNYVDGQSSTHTWPQWNPYWQVEGIAGPVSKVRIWNRSDCCGGDLVGVNVDLLDSSGVIASREIQGIRAFWELDFGSVGGVAKVRLSKNAYDYLALPEVEVLGSSGESLLTGSSVASQSSEIDCSGCLRYGYGTAGALASLAIDGDTNGNMGDETVFHTMTQVDPWWQVDLGLTATVSKIIIWNRTDCCGDRLVGAKIHLQDASGNIMHTETVTSSGESSALEFAPVQDVTAIRVAMEDTAPSQVVLNFAEVEAFGNIQN